MEDAAMLSPIQQVVLFHALSTPQTGASMGQLVITHKAPLEEARLREALAWLSARHGVLCTRLAKESGDEPLQHVTWLSERQFVWTLPHALLDGRSYATLLDELFARYADPHLVLPDPPPYHDYIDWLARQNPASSDAFWTDLLGDVRAPTVLGVERLGDTDPRGGEAQVERTLTDALTAALGALARTLDVTLDTLVQGAWGVLLARYSREDDVVFGAVRACRHVPVEGAEEIVGPLINTVPVRVAPRPDLTLAAYLTALRAQHLAVRPHEHTPLSHVQSLTKIPRGSRLFDSVVMFETSPLAERTGFDVVLHESTGYPLTLLACGGKKLQLSLHYDSARFSEATAERLLGHLEALLAGFPDSAEARLAELPLLSQAERVLLEAYATPETDVPVTECLHERFSRQARLTPDAAAVSFEGASLTYAQLEERSNRLAHRLMRLGVGPEVLVGLRVERTPDIVVGILAILKAGGAYLPIDTAYPDERAEFLLKDAGAAALLTRRALSALPGSHETLYFDDDLSGEPSAEPRSTATPDSLAYVIYTSGSTGKPKGVAITHRNVLRLFAATDAWFGFHSRDVWTLFHSHAFDFSVWEIWGALLYGGRVVVVPYHTSRDPGAFLSLVRTERVTVLNQTPSAFRQLIAADGARSGKNSLRYVIFGGEALDLASLRPWIARHGDAAPQLINMYGITETCVHVTYRPLSAADIEEARGSVIGRPLPDLSLQVLQPSGEPCPLGVPGELFVGGAGLARGYVGRDELTAERFPTGGPNGRLYRTGDLARRLPNGDIEYLGRIDQQVQLRGFRIELGEIESALAMFSGVSECAVVLREDTPGEQRLVAYLVATPEPSVSRLREHLSKTLPAYMVPSAFVFLPTLPLTGNGKIDRKALPAPTFDRESADIAPPRSDTEATLVRLWEEVLRQSGIGIHDNFFERGGDSILLVGLHRKLCAALGRDVPLVALFTHPTIARLARFLDGGEQEVSLRDAAQDRVNKLRAAQARQRPVTRR